MHPEDTHRSTERSDVQSATSGIQVGLHSEVSCAHIHTCSICLAQAFFFVLSVSAYRRDRRDFSRIVLWEISSLTVMGPDNHASPFTLEMQLEGLSELMWAAVRLLVEGLQRISRHTSTSRNTQTVGVSKAARCYLPHCFWCSSIERVLHVWQYLQECGYAATLEMFQVFSDPKHVE